MKKATLFSVLMAFCFVTIAQVPESFNYQVVVRDGASNNPLVNQDVSFRMSILKGSISGESQYSELHSANTGVLGIVNLVIGNGTGKTGNITTIDWGADTYYLKVEIDKTGGSGFVEMGTTQLLTVPYAMYTKRAETADDAVKLTGDQTIGGTKTFSNTIVANNGMNANSNTITNVANPTQAQDVATKAYVTLRVSFTGDTLCLGNDQYVIIPGIGDANIPASGSYTDSRDGTIYEYITIGDQVWMAENLKYLPSVVGPATGSATTPYYYVYDYDGTNVTDAKATANYSDYGVLYNWTAAMNGQANTGNPNGVQGVCPTYWHLPSDYEWTQLNNYYNGSAGNAGGKLKETGTTHWNPPNTLATNESGFTGLPGGGRYFDGTNGLFYYEGTNGNWWTSTEYDATYAYYHSLYYNSTIVDTGYNYKEDGFSVRCVRDN